MLQLTYKHIAILFDCATLATAQTRTNAIRRKLGLKRHECLTLGVFCDYHKIPVAEAKEKLESKK